MSARIEKFISKSIEKRNFHEKHKQYIYSLKIVIGIIIIASSGIEQ